ncbi:MAG: hypothetical protein Kow00129_16640 [Thermoleophilia bacterium]
MVGAPAGLFLSGVTLALACLALLLLPAWGLQSAEAATLEERRVELERARQRLAEIQGELDGLTEEYSRSEARLYEIDVLVEKAESDEARTRRDLAEMQARLMERVVELYKSRRSATPVYLELLLQEGGFLEVIHRASMLNRVAEDDRRFFSEMGEHLDRVQALERDLHEKRTEQAEEVRRLAQAEKAMEARLAAVSGEYTRLKQIVQRLEEEERRAREAAARARAAERAAGPRSGGSGAISGFVFPVAGPHSYINDWGFPRSGGRSHKGTDIMAPRGTPVVAVVSGLVSRTTYNRGLGGTTVWLRGSDGSSYYYAHLDGIAPGIGSGTRVSAGRVLGYVGNSGNARGGATHLHFEIRRGGRAINPYPILRAAE